jgi:cytochrome c
MNSVSHRYLAVGLMSVLTVFLAACTAHQKPSTVETVLATMAKDIVIPIEAEELKNPLSWDPQVETQGQQVYVQSCAVCHGPDGHGQTPMGQSMYPPALDLTSPHVQHWNDSEMFWIIQNGVRMTGMSSWKDTISASDTWKLVLFVHHLPGLDNAEAKG